MSLGGPVREIFGVLRRGVGWSIEADGRTHSLGYVDEPYPGQYVGKRRHWLVLGSLAVIDRRTAAARSLDTADGNIPAFPASRNKDLPTWGAPGTGKRR